MTVYILVATGRYRGTDGINKMLSAKAWKDRKAAEAEMPAFRRRCVGDGSRFADMDPHQPIVVSMLKLEVVE